MARQKRKISPVILFAGVVLVLFVVLPRAMGWMSVQLRDFAIPVAGGPHLTSADDWRSEVRTLSRDLSTFWRAALAEAAVSFAPPEIAAGFEGRRPVCGGLVETASVVYCFEPARIELNRIRFNGISRAAAPGANHLAVAYAFARLYSRPVQSALGVALSETGAEAGRIALDLQAECLAGFWLGRAPETYGRVSELQLDRVIRSTHVGPWDREAPRPGMLFEDFWRAPVDDRVEWVMRGFRAETIAVCTAASRG